ncbi:hypothetical protein ACIBKX_28210 [Streptomyces sp. NPDC050658]|uniref:hypothetical protein n=1 Tax=Streptomyces sp. NPDC050658 TaxID=3365633 RepID=UPI0037A2D667
MGGADEGGGEGVEVRLGRDAAPVGVWEREYTRDEWLDQLPTQGAFTRLPPDQLAQVLEAVGAAIDAMGGRFTMPYATVAVMATTR